MIKINIENGKISGETSSLHVDKEWDYGEKYLHTPLGTISLAAGCDLVHGQIIVSDDYKYVILQTVSESRTRWYAEFYSSLNERYTDASVAVYSLAHQEKLDSIFYKMKKHLKPMKKQ